MDKGILKRSIIVIGLAAAIFILSSCKILQDNGCESDKPYLCQNSGNDCKLHANECCGEGYTGPICVINDVVTKCGPCLDGSGSEPSGSSEGESESESESKCPDNEYICKTNADGSLICCDRYTEDCEGGVCKPCAPDTPCGMDPKTGIITQCCTAGYKCIPNDFNPCQNRACEEYTEKECGSYCVPSSANAEVKCCEYGPTPQKKSVYSAPACCNPASGPTIACGSSESESPSEPQSESELPLKCSGDCTDCDTSVCKCVDDKCVSCCVRSTIPGQPADQTCNGKDRTSCAGDIYCTTVGGPCWSIFD